QGIGEATARLCAERGAAVVIADFNREIGECVAADICDQGGQAEFIAADMRDAEQVRELFEAIRQRHGRVDALICAAGVLKGPFLQPEEFPLDDFEMVIDVNIKGPFLCARYGAPLLDASQHAVMVVVASGAGVIGPSSSLAYGA